MNLSTHLTLVALVAVALISNADAEPVARMQVGEIKPLLVGAISDRTGSLTLGLAALVACALILGGIETVVAVRRPDAPGQRSI